MQIIRVGIGVVVLDEQGRVLLGQRNKEAKRKTGKLNDDWDWSLPGDGLEYGESFEDCAIREVREETTLNIHDPVVFCVHNDTDSFAHWVTLGVRATKFSGVPISAEPQNYVTWEWFALDNLPARIFPPSARVIQALKSAN